jgi:hypothetical protein
MRYPNWILLLVLCCTAAAAKNAAPSKPESVDFCGHQLFFAFAGQNFDEYIPHGQTLETWTRLASIRTVKNFDDPLEYAKRFAEQIKKDNPLSSSAIGHNQKKQIAIIDFITWPRDLSYVEFNIWRIEKSGNNGLIAYQYAEREYKEQKKFLLVLKDLRLQTITEMRDRGLTINKSPNTNPQVSSRSRQSNR